MRVANRTIDSKRPAFLGKFTKRQNFATIAVASPERHRPQSGRWRNLRASFGFACFRFHWYGEFLLLLKVYRQRPPCGANGDDSTIISRVRTGRVLTLAFDRVRRYAFSIFERANVMKLGLINSAWVQANKGTVYGIEKTKEIGFDSIDIFTDPLEIDIRERRLIRDCCQANDLPIVSICCVAVGLIDFNPTVRNFHIQRCQAYLDLCYEYGAHNLLLVLGEYIWNREVIPPREQWDLAVDACQRLGRYSENLGVKIALELEPFHLSLLNNVDTMLQFIRDCDHPAVKANIDISHLLLANVKATEMTKLQGQAIHVHISDCDGKVHGDLPPGRGVVPFDSYLAELAKLKIDGAISLELEYSPEPDKIVQWVTEAYLETHKLMQKFDLR